MSKEIEVAALQRIIEEQANDEGLWFKSVYITESYLQSELRRLHEAAEVVIAASQQGSIATQVEQEAPYIPPRYKKEDWAMLADAKKLLNELEFGPDKVMVDREDLQELLDGAEFVAKELEVRIEALLSIDGSNG